MTILIRVYLICLAVLVTLPFSARAQENCAIIPEAIEHLGVPDLRTYNIWDVVYGVPLEDETFYDYLPIDDEKVILVGSTRNDLKARPFILSTDRRGRVFWQWKGNPDSGSSLILKRILDIDGKTFLTAGRLVQDGVPQGIWLGIFNRKDGTLIKTHVLQKSGAHLEFTDLERNINGNGYILSAVQTGMQDSATPPHARFYLLDQKLNVTKDRAFIPAHENYIHDLLVTQSEYGEKFYLAVGEAQNAYGRTEAVILRLDPYLNVAWQRAFPRGAGSRFFGVTRTRTSEITAVGDVLPAMENASRAGLLVTIDLAQGTVNQERYYSFADIDYTGKDVLTLKDGRTLLMLAGYTRNEEHKADHARYIILSPRGMIMQDLSYSHGRGAIPEEMKIGPLDRIYIGGSATIEDPDPEDPENKTIRSQDGWMVVGEPVGTYEDPCIPKIREFPKIRGFDDN